MVLGDQLGADARLHSRRRAARACPLGHRKKNAGFNELVTRWHADHVYRHEPTALLVCTLLAMLCLNVCLAFYRRDLKPAARQAVSRLHVARQISSELYADGHATAPRAPPPPARRAPGFPAP